MDYDNIVDKERVLDFERILALSYKACKFIKYKYGCDISLAEEKALDVWAENKDYIKLLAEYTDTSKNDAEKKIYFLFKDSIRSSLGIYQTVASDGKRVWFSPYLKEEVEGYDTIIDDFAGLEELEEQKQKDIFYEHINDFHLTKNEKLFIDLCFSGFNPANPIDVLVFKEALQTTSNGYVKTFFNRLCKKLEDESTRIGLR